MTPVTCDTSVLVPTLLTWHDDHETSREAFGTVTGLTAHVLVETFSVLTRLPAPHRVAPADAAAALAALERAGLPVLALAGSAYHPLLQVLALEGIRGGVVYDGLVGVTAKEHGHVLLTRDRRARTTYDTLAVDYRMI